MSTFLVLVFIYPIIVVRIILKVINYNVTFLRDNLPRDLDKTSSSSRYILEELFQHMNSIHEYVKLKIEK